MKVLIVEPDWRFAQQATSYLESHAHLVVHTTRTAEATEKAAHWKPDLVIVSSELTDNGLLEAFAQNTPKSAVLLTGWMDRYDIAWRAWQRGGDELLLKPLLRTEELQEAIVTALENATAGVRTPRRSVSSA